MVNNEGLRREVIGKVIMTPQGEWNIKKMYNVLDYVTLHGSAYLCIKENAGYLPSKFNEYWSLLCEKGEKGDKGDRGETSAEAPVFTGTWDKDKEYEKMDVVLFNGSSYICIPTKLQGIRPDYDETYLSGETNPDGDKVGEVDVDLRKWQLICKGVDYKIDKNGQIVFYNADDQIQGIKTYINNVYIKSTDSLFIKPDSKEEVITEITLKKKLDSMQTTLDRCKRMLKKYNIWDYDDDTNESIEVDSGGSKNPDTDTTTPDNSTTIDDTILSGILYKLDKIFKILEKHGFLDDETNDSNTPDNSDGDSCCH